MDPTLQAIEETLLKVRTSNVVVAGDFHAKHLVWGPNAGDERGARLLEFAAANELIVLNDPQSRPTYETPYAASWINVTLPSFTAVQSGFQWEVREDLTHSEHRYIEIRIGGSEVRTGKQLTRFAQAELLRALGRNAWFDQVLGADISSMIALDFVMEAFYKIFQGHQHKKLRPVKSRAGKSWWTPQLTEERKRVNATRRRFQRCRDNDLRVWYRYEYSKALALLRARIREARDRYEAECNAACSRRSVFSAHFREAFGRTKSRKFLPPLEGPDGTLTSSHFESAALLLRTHVAVDDPDVDLPVHIATRELAAASYQSGLQDVPFTDGEVKEVIGKVSPNSAPGPDGITPSIVKGLYELRPKFVIFVLNAH
ncbi:hypothetical protein HPB51_026711 [Rhipicephalus microplus]|uniref:Endonuclease/exonuclease/phosphatase domain-containing protein n=1 Tax=Rhipicephalus microplus TaxID=6941 RepID=A0A9J6D2B9_RHIMP|nr:hypothetical protein HPB51_026711 [Rhipicephalus microplus]